MKSYEVSKQNGFDTSNHSELPIIGKGRVIDLVLPIVVLIAACIWQCFIQVDCLKELELWKHLPTVLPPKVLSWDLSLH